MTCGDTGPLGLPAGAGRGESGWRALVGGSCALSLSLCLDNSRSHREAQGVRATRRIPAGFPPTDAI